MGSWLGSLRSSSLTCREGVLAMGMVLLYILVAPVAYWCGGAVGLLTAAVAGGVCLFAFALALALSSVFRHPSLAIHGVVLAMAVRTGIPLLFALSIRLCAGPLLETGLVNCLVVFYLGALGLEMPLSLPHRGRPESHARLSQDVV